MASARNQVLKGCFEGLKILKQPLQNELFIYIDRKNSFPLNKETIESYDLMTEEKMKSASSAVMRAGAGALLLGPVGLLAGISAKNKGICLVALQFETGEQSLIEISDKLYKILVTSMF